MRLGFALQGERLTSAREAASVAKEYHDPDAVAQRLLRASDVVGARGGTREWRGMASALRQAMAARLERNGLRGTRGD
jgi:hypothetical protein